jgi:hypothetical protein
MKPLLILLFFSLNVHGQTITERPSKKTGSLTRYIDSIQIEIDYNNTSRLLSDTTPIYTTLDNPRIPYKVTRYYFNSINEVEKVVIEGSQGPISFYYNDQSLIKVRLDTYENEERVPVNFYYSKADNELSISTIKDYLNINPNDKYDFELLILGKAYHRLAYIQPQQ